AARCTAGSNGMASERRRKRKLRYERRILTLALLTGLPAVILALLLLWAGDFAARTQWTVAILLVGVWLAFVGVVRERVIRPLQTISNMLAALREGDFSLRAWRATRPACSRLRSRGGRGLDAGSCGVARFARAGSPISSSCSPT